MTFCGSGASKIFATFGCSRATRLPLPVVLASISRARRRFDAGHRAYASELQFFKV